ncbi:MAG: DUF2330 domain-containing protein [Deltaproteobacteria bacterium]|nr:DUF2330 domain-containing protein [Deltaproteobacteria bacterium]
MRALVLPVGLVCCAALGPAERANACGGLFCAANSPTPVDQQAERVLFEVEDDGSVTATVEVKYGGDPSAFSWIIPVSEAPDLIEVGSQDVLTLLDGATRPTFIPPTLDQSSCPTPVTLPGCPPVEPMAPPPPPPMATGGIGVTQYPNVGPYTDIIVVEGSDPSALMTFLNDNGYLVTEAMRPVFAEYTAESQRFLAIQLQPDAEVKDIVPVRFHCPAPGPVIPLRLTRVAALPEMGLLVLIAAERRYRPGNYSELVIPPEDIHIDGSGQSNYFPLLSKRIDEFGGTSFVVERAEASANVRPLVDGAFLGTEGEADARAEVDRLLTERPYLTRLYSRMSGHEMILAPVFMESDGGDVSSTIDLSSQVIDLCGQNTQAPPCGLLYCGDLDACATTAGPDGCVCQTSRTARAATAPDGTPSVSCVPTDYDFIGGAGMRGCDGVDCGLGLCMPQNGTATCRCDDGAAAVVDTGSAAGVRCIPSLQTYSSDQILWRQAGVPVSTACSGGRIPLGNALSLAVLLGISLLVRLGRFRSRTARSGTGESSRATDS